MSKKIPNQLLVIFGASGDLNARKLIPAVYNLYKGGFLPESFGVLGVSRTPFSDEEFREKAVYNNDHLKKKLENKDEDLTDFADKLYYQPIKSYDQDDYKGLADRIKALDGQLEGGGNVTFYLSTPPKLYEVIAQKLSSHGLNKHSEGFKTLIVEKPFGYDLDSARHLNEALLKCFEEEQIYRIDHYLGKETVQNLFVMRFANSIFEPLWNRNFIHRVEITSAESVGVEKRGGYYDTSGALRDMVQNHLLQLIAMVAMEPPARVDSEAIRNEKKKLFRSIRPLTKEDIYTNVIRGQYTASTVKGEAVKGYREEEGVNPESKTETFVAMKFFIDNWRWAGVPFYVRTGKKLPTRVAEVVIHFKPNHLPLFQNQTVLNSQNMLIFRIQPDEGILMKIGLKVPGAGFDVKNVNVDFLYEDLTDAYLPDAYERLLLDGMNGDATLYARGDSVEAAWEFIDPILEAWKNDPNVPIYGYPAGTWGPENVDDLIEGENMIWRYPCANLTNDGIYCEL
ncbi:MAG: glucose-6-phosphate dehydrogenase [Bacteroidota bacterium]